MQYTFTFRLRAYRMIRFLNIHFLSHLLRVLHKPAGFRTDICITYTVCDASFYTRAPAGCCAQKKKRGREYTCRSRLWVSRRFRTVRSSVNAKNYTFDSNATLKIVASKNNTILRVVLGLFLFIFIK